MSTMGSDTETHSLRGGARQGENNSDVRLTLPARPENVAVVRHVLGAFADALRLPDDMVEDMRLAVTEACTNVVRHAYRDGEPGPIDIAIRPDGDDRLELIVSDRGNGMGSSLDVGGPGLGLPLIAAVADHVDLEHERPRGSRLSMSFRRRPRVGVA
jgi:serine/threonine-protein kinase RsbW